MSTTLVFGAVYVTVCLFCLTMMLFEQRHSQPPSLFYRLAGILACIVWPVSLACVAFTLRARPA